MIDTLRVRRLIQTATGLPRTLKRAIMVLADVVVLPLILFASLALTVDATAAADSGWLYAGAGITTVPVFAKLGLYRAVLRYIGAKAMATIVVGVTASVALLLAFDVWFWRGAVPHGVLLTYWALALNYVAGSRYLVRVALQSADPDGQRVVVYGAGDAGARLAMALLGGKGFRPVAFVDDDPALWGSAIGGIEVHDPAKLRRLIPAQRITGVLLAIPSESRRRRREILAQLEPLGLHVRTIPDLSDIVAGRVRVDDVHEVDMCDLLGREAVAPNQALLRGSIDGKSVLVTGAGGSIGSELCRQIVRLKPTRLVLFEQSEIALYAIEKNLQLILASEPRPRPVQIVALLGSATNSYRMREIMQVYGVHTVYHAAAYKHVPIVEQNVTDGIHNNTFATLHTALAAHEAGVEIFVLVSTDKAVNPTNVMGATKRLAELVLQALQRRGSGTRFCMVRFGNVLDSSGSVVPLFREQIARGGPITVTHPDIIRYFMTIEEAAQVVIQAAAMATGGDVFVLDMGKPVRIDDLARRLVHLMGSSVRDEQNPDGDIEILYTGLRPAEKLYEELLIGANAARTEHPMILRAVEHSLPWDQLLRLLDKLRDAVRRYDCKLAREILAEAVVEYVPSPAIEDMVWKHTRVVPKANGWRHASRPALDRHVKPPLTRA